MPLQIFTVIGLAGFSWIGIWGLISGVMQRGSIWHALGWFAYTAGFAVLFLGGYNLLVIKISTTAERQMLKVIESIIADDRSAAVTINLLS